MVKEFPKVDSEIFPGGENPNFGQKAVLIASISSADQALIGNNKVDAMLDPSFLKGQWGRTHLVNLNGTYDTFGLEYEYPFPWRGYDLAAQLYFNNLNSESYLDQYIIGASSQVFFPLGEFMIGAGPLVQSIMNHDRERYADMGVRASIRYTYHQWLFELGGQKSVKVNQVLASLAKKI